MNFISKLAEILGRIDYLITYALVQFVQKVLERTFSSADTLLVAGGVMMLCSAAGEGQRGVLSLTARSCHKVSAVLFAQHLMGLVPSPGGEHTSMFLVVLYWLLATSAVVVLPTLLAPVVTEEAASEVYNLVFFVYAENASFLVHHLHLERELPAIALIVLYGVQSRMPAALGVEVTVLRATSMLATNVLVGTLLATPGTTSAGGVEIGFLVAALIVFDGLAARIPAGGALRDYAVWKGATLVVTHLSVAGVPLDALLLGGLFLTAAAHALQEMLAEVGAVLRSDATVQIGVLVSTNVALEKVRGALDGTPVSFSWGILLATVNLVHLLLLTLKAPP